MQGWLARRCTVPASTVAAWHDSRSPEARQPAHASLTSHHARRPLTLSPPHLHPPTLPATEAATADVCPPILVLVAGCDDASTRRPPRPRGWQSGWIIALTLAKALDVDSSGLVIRRETAPCDFPPPRHHPTHVRGRPLLTFDSLVAHVTARQYRSGPCKHSTRQSRARDLHPARCYLPLTLHPAAWAERWTGRYVPFPARMTGLCPSISGLLPEGKGRGRGGSRSHGRV